MTPVSEFLASGVQFFCGGSSLGGQSGGEEGKAVLRQHEAVVLPGGGKWVSGCAGVEGGGKGCVQGGDAVELAGDGLLRYRMSEFNRLWLVGQAVKTSPSHGENSGSIPLRAVDYFE